MKLMGQVDLDRHRIESKSTCLQIALASDRSCLRERLRLDQAPGAVVHDMTIPAQALDRFSLGSINRINVAYHQ